MEQIKAFIEKANTDSELMAKFEALGAKNAGADEIIVLAAEYGFTFTAQEYKQVKAAASAPQMGELNEEELGAVSGGTENRYDPNVCKPSLGRTRYECVGLFGLFPCDHYSMTGESEGPGGRLTAFWHKCARGAFHYKGDRNGGSL